MKVSIYVTIAPNADRPYVTTFPPPEDLAEHRKQLGIRVF
jgi:hypothetical protein